MDQADLAAASAMLRAVVDGVVRAEDVTADPVELAYLRGSTDTLEQVADQRPDFLKSGPDVRDGGRGTSPQAAESQ